MPPSTSQKVLIDHFVARTGTDRKRAERLLKAAGWDLEASLRSNYPGSSGPSESSLKAQFESLRTSEDPADTMGADSTMSYLQQLGVSLDDASMFLGLQVLQAEKIGELSKERFVKSWKEANVEGDVTHQKNYIAGKLRLMPNDPKIFRDVYRHAFNLGKEGEARAVTLEMAETFWQILFAAPGRPWVGNQTGINWLEQWQAFLNEKWTRTVSKDMWNQTYEFAAKSIEDESLSFWSEDGAWPGVIDQFVAWYREKYPATGAMEVDS
ncbi:Scaffold-type E3 ligase [Neopestalotiopsis sp. 37M]|nr:Scaffold-type E3 ligase [Neopestalotiopsis sp. 37M]